jgi:hypothetical protein
MIYALAGGERGQEQNFGLSPCLLGKKIIAWGLKKQLSSAHNHRWIKAAEILDIDICLTSKLFARLQRWRNRVISWLFQNNFDCRFPAFA